VTRVSVNGAELVVQVTGRGPAVLALHGFTGAARTWAPLAAALLDQRRVIAPDLLGHGRSAAPSDPARYALERQADDLSALLAALDAVPADVMGYSMGARLALVLALRHPAVVRGLILESPSAGISDGAERARRRVSDDALAGQLERDGLASFVETWEAQLLFASQSALPHDVRGGLRAERLSHDPRGLAASLRGAGQGVMAPLHARLAAVGCPALVIAGALDPVGSERARLVAAGLPTARLEMIDGAGHAPHLEQPEAFLRLAGEHLAVTTSPVHERTDPWPSSGPPSETTTTSGTSTPGRASPRSPSTGSTSATPSARRR
jgi:2-succinyl-6-hydroxy-2,4-cyclohexadiene-1-carboxylate synthase